MSFSAKEAPEEMTDERTPFSRAKSLAAYCRSSAFDHSDGRPREQRDHQRVVRRERAPLESDAENAA